MIKEAIQHRPINNFAYSYDENTLHIQLKTKKNDMKSVELIFGDPYFWLNNKWQSNSALMQKSGSTKYHDYWFIEISPEFQRLRYGFKCSDSKESCYFTEGGIFKVQPEDISNYFCFPYLNNTDIFQAPSWVKDTVWYQIFPERFANGDKNLNPPNTLKWDSEKPSQNNFFGGDFQGIIDHLDYLTDLGINGIYLTPIFEAYSNHKYDTIDYMKIDPQFGDEETFRRLVQECHKRNIKIMLDAVFNHSGYYFAPFQDVLKKQQNSNYKDWFHIWNFPIEQNSEFNYATFGFEKSMPKLNTENIEVKNYLLRVAKYWTEEFDIDGWRLDVANEVDHAFWREFRQTVKKIKPDAYILGEIWHDAMPWLQGDQFDAVMNYPVTNGIIDFFAKQKIDAQQFINHINQVIHMYPSNVNEVSFNLLDSHDTSRILTMAKHNKDRLKLAYLFQFSFIGAPCIYYGDEIGMFGGEDPECRACMIWDEHRYDEDLYSFIQILIKLRKTVSAFGGNGKFRFLDVGDKKDVITYEKYTKKEKLVFILNNSEDKQQIELSSMQYKRAKGLLTNKEYNFSNQTMIELNAYDFKILQLIE